MYLIGGKVGSQAKKRRTSHHLADRNQQENRKESIDAVL
jgi:hypothetical protein